MRCEQGAFPAATSLLYTAAFWILQRVRFCALELRFSIVYGRTVKSGLTATLTLLAYTIDHACFCLTGLPLPLKLLCVW
jgi:hypothetical protein